MNASHRFFNNAACAYFPCHKTARPEEFNCLFCFCPLYFLDNCVGTPGYTPEGIKDCSGCTVPHCPDGYDRIMARLKEEFARRRSSVD